MIVVSPIVFSESNSLSCSGKIRLDIFRFVFASARRERVLELCIIDGGRSSISLTRLYVQFFFGGGGGRRAAGEGGEEFVFFFGIFDQKNEEEYCVCYQIEEITAMVSSASAGIAPSPVLESRTR